MVNFPFICSHIPAAHVYGVYISWLMRDSRACGSYHDSRAQSTSANNDVTEPGFLVVKLKSSLRKCYGYHYDLANRYGISVSQMTTDHDGCQ